MKRTKDRLFWGIALLGLICLAGVTHITRPSDWRERTRQELSEAAQEIKEETKELSDSLKKSFESGRDNLKKGLEEIR
ncbi:YtxH domain-containing protein [Enterococcus sp. BWR-S5]|uniref:YtxH domain-containing protein n=1 Tax=Enterococcus sp. BWR-S5 TaxID=2787714 RepID=UPI0019242AD3|nr:YtxH domain-containing protein [Enterococcus sp. BWR-S5]MBL1225915.1 YtxH domain-containing protein [Enterococcus sp. BWR-S5]